MQYFAGLVVFAGIGSFLITDTIVFYQDWKRRDRSGFSYVDLIRLLFLAAMTAVGYRVASGTFQAPNDWIRFLAVGLIGAVSAHLIAQWWKSSR
ncbi:hypothetical protein IQ268_25770 [Oculatella sp. LEGE 06141]|uniref:hypothetical protein n=1 Tax=Oculatella sp. LEGE 06141 TaxID=1828648 RepID=UPI0018815A45|nr:hypothetical protein [Oculatella sp. LEGE 06141]MBE9181981.1 hypothetical protein [Oculatella sp. LEGE 06141]